MDPNVVITSPTTLKSSVPSVSAPAMDTPTVSSSGPSSSPSIGASDAPITTSGGKWKK